jgi:hypothetical protein
MVRSSPVTVTAQAQETQTLAVYAVDIKNNVYLGGSWGTLKYDGVEYVVSGGRALFLAQPVGSTHLLEFVSAPGYRFDHWVGFSGDSWVSPIISNPYSPSTNVTIQSGGPNGMAVYLWPVHVLTVKTDPAAISPIPFTIDGTGAVTPYTKTLDEGTYTIIMPDTYLLKNVLWRFDHWEDGSISPRRTINLTADMTLTAYYVAPPVRIPTSISINVNPTSGVVPFTVTISGVLTDNVGNPLAGKTVNLYMDTTLVSTTTTGTDGAYSFNRTISEAGTYTFQTEFPGDETYEGCTIHNGTLASSVPAAVPPRGPLGLWWYPILVRLAQYFPWAQRLLEYLRTLGTL